MSAADLYLCLDQGGHSSRALIIGRDGEVHAKASRPVDTRRSGTEVEHCPAELVTTLRDSAADALSQLGETRGRVVAAGLATQRSSIVCWDRSTREPLSNVLSWQDTRAAGWLDQFAAHWDPVHEATGLVLSPYYGVSKLIWCLENLADVRGARDEGRLQCGPLASFLAQSLTASAEACADPANGSRTLLWDKNARGWSAALLELFGMPGDLLPRAVPSRHAWGDIEIDEQRIPLTVVTGDQSAALFAFGRPDPSVVYANLGTGAFVQRQADKAFSPGRLLASVVYQDEQHATEILEGTVNGAGSALTEVANARGISRETLHARSAEWLTAVTDPPLFLNTVGGLGSPWWQSDVSHQFSPDPNADADAIAAVLESIVFLLNTNLGEMERTLGAADRIVVTGGLATVEPLLQKLADCSGLTVQRARVREATCTGLAWLLAGLPSDWPPVNPDAEFTATADVALSARYQEWLAQMPNYS